jgi:hypothetical protein
MRNGTPSLGHGDRFHIGDLDPDRPGLEGYAVQQNNPAFITEAYWDAATGEVLHYHTTTALTDDGRGQAGDIDPNHRGYEYWSFYGIYNSSTPVAGQAPVETKIADDPNRPWPNFRVWWDGDVGSEDLNDTVINKWNPTTKGNDRLTTLYHYGSPFSTSGEAPIFYGDIFGDWREEVIFENSDHLALDIYTTQYASSTRLYTLAENPEYRNCMTVKGYYQSNMVDYYLGYGMTTPPTPNIQVLGSAAGAVPSVAAAASASSNPVTGKSVNLSVLGADGGGEQALTYTWSAAGPASVYFSSNGANASKNTAATFASTGTYIFTVTIRDASGRTALANVKVTVNQTLSGFKLAPVIAQVATNSNRQFIATALDQFGAAMTAQAAISWSVITGGGSIDSNGLYTPPATTRSATVQASSGSVSATATLAINGPAPDAPASLTAGALTIHQIQLNWLDSVTGESGFVIERSTDGVVFTDIGAASANATTFIATGLVPNTSYAFRVRSNSANGAGLPSNIASATTFAAPIEWLKLDESSGTIAADSSGNSNYGTMANGPAWSTGKFGNALNFDGSDDYAQLANDNMSTGAGSVSMWIKTGANFSNYAMLFFMSADTFGNGFGSQPELHLNFSSAEKLQLFIQGSPAGQFANNVTLTSADSYNNNAWHHVVATWSAGGNAVLYVDGASVASAAFNPTVTTTNSQRTFLSNTSLNGNRYAGLIDDVRLYNTSINAAQVQALYNDTAAPTIDATTLWTDAAPNTIRFAFSEPVTLTNPLANLLITQDGGGSVVPSGFAYDPATDIATFTLPAPLADGTYRASFAAGSVRDGSGNALASGFTFPFSFLRSDANNDGRVNALDFNILATRFGQSLPAQSKSIALLAASQATADLFSNSRVDAEDSVLS